jgi:hypothetical protein
VPYPRSGKVCQGEGTLKKITVLRTRSRRCHTTLSGRVPERNTRFYEEPKTKERREYMRKMILLAAMMAIAALMLAAAPALADDNDGDGHDDVTFRFVGHDFCDFFGFFGCINHDDDDFCDFVDCHDDDDFCDFVDCHDEDDFCDFFDRDNFCDDDFDRFDFNDGFGDFEQDAESGDIDQSFDVSGTGDNSNQTVGIQGVANTGNAQNQIGVVDADGFGDFDDNDFCDDFNNRNDFCDDFNNGDDFCEDFRGDDFCEDLEDFCEDFNGDNICDFFFDHDDRFFFHDDDDDRFFFGDDNDGDIEFEDVGSTIELSPTNTVSSDQQVNQAASAFGS